MRRVSIKNPINSYKEPRLTARARALGVSKLEMNSASRRKPYFWLFNSTGKLLVRGTLCHVGESAGANHFKEERVVKAE